MDIPEMIKPDGSRGVTQAHFMCCSYEIFPEHFMPADKLFWYDGKEERAEKAGWYCLLCHPHPNLKGWRMIDELLETNSDMTRII